MEHDPRIGARVRAIRRRRGLSQAVAAGLAGISTSYLSRLETGQREFNRRGLVENLAEALGCSPTDLTGTVSTIPDRRALAAASAIPSVSAVLLDTTLDDVPDIPTRPVDQLSALARKVHTDADDATYSMTGDSLGILIAELHIAARAGRAEDQRQALLGIIDACIAARSVAGALGNGELAVIAIRRAWDAAQRLERPDLVGLTAMSRAIALNRIGARRTAENLLATTLTNLDQLPDAARNDTTIEQARGMAHLSSAHLAARDGRRAVVATHLEEAGSLARFTGEQNHLNFHFGPTNVAAWSLTIAVESDEGPDVAERIESSGVTLDRLASRDRLSSVHFDFARAYAQAEGARDADVLRHLDLADRIAPVRIRQDPIARELVVGLDRRARRRAWELTSLKNRPGVA
jgi:transcriptional regulator with XRE-family HTH domain